MLYIVKHRVFVVTFAQDLGCGNTFITSFARNFCGGYFRYFQTLSQAHNMADASFLSSTRGDPATSVAGEEAAMATKKSSSAADAAAKSATAEL